MSPGKIKEAPQPPPLFTATPTSIIEDAKRLIDQSRKVQDQVVSTVQPENATFQNTLLPLAQEENRVSVYRYVLTFYRDVSPDAELRKASSDADQVFDDFERDTGLRKELFALVDEVFKKDNEDLDDESLLYLKKTHRRFFTNGMGLPAGPRRDRFKQIKKRLSEIAIEFRKNLVEEDGELWFTPEELAGVPDDVLSGWEKGADGSEHQGKLRLTFQYTDYFPVLDNARHEETRRRAFIANDNKCNQNVPLFKEAMVLRDEAARLLGYPNHTAYRLEDRMAKLPEKVNSFLDGLISKFTAKGHEELEKLKELKGADVGDRFDGHYYLWDRRFYHRLMMKKDYAVDQQKIAEYFPLDSTFQKMLAIFEDLFGLKFIELNGESDFVWHSDVRLFSVWDDEAEGGEFLGYLYIDLHPRPGKYGHAANFNLRRGFIDASGKRSYPATALVCNFTKSTPAKPSLLKHGELLMLFHELGHGIHDLVAKTAFAHFHGTQTVDDFCETPSKMLENWFWSPIPLQSISQHYHTGESIPDDMIHRLVQTRQVNIALSYLQQLSLSMFDIAVHSPESHEAIQEMNTSEVFNSIRKTVALAEGPEVQLGRYDWGHGEVIWSHLLGAYDVGYYGYLQAELYALDMFSTFFQSDPLNAKEGRRFRRMVLEKGGGQDEMKTLVDYLGREPNSNSLYESLGII
ncbi:metallopeptidase MepB [Aspergillus sclerotiicarbonarius CBS 121057]|uniref:Metallopeptidase MepB n=1 Tax=Aspergillus sclerotiicarbonarius (strain CBS 121057 / IBT 28362) TaxID=1448318 RepID=A0A319DV56_ASPSB|nr:metallopeptidase MepB [Aspergillus sclerotiicarbonarius CBS 121057]